MLSVIRWTQSVNEFFRTNRSQRRYSRRSGSPSAALVYKVVEKLEVKEMMTATPSWLDASIMQKSFNPSDIPAIRAELFAPSNNLPATGSVIQYPDGTITWEQYPGKLAEPRELSATQVFVDGYVVDLKNPSEDRFRVFDGEKGWSSTYFEYGDTGGLPDWVKDNFVAKLGDTDVFGNPLEAGSVHILGGLVDLGTPEWPGAGDGAFWWIPDRIGAFDLSPYFVTHDWDFDPRTLTQLVSIVGKELNSFGVGVASDLAILPIQTIYSGSTTIVGLIKAGKNDLDSLVNTISEAFVKADSSQVSQLPPLSFDATQQRRTGLEDPKLLNLVTHRGENGELTTVGFDKNGAQVTKQYAPNGSGDFVLKGTEVVYQSKDQDTVVSLSYSGQSTTNPDIRVSFKGSLIDGEKLGTVLGPQLIGILGVDNPFQKLAANTLSTTVLSNALEFITDLGQSLVHDIPLPSGYESVTEFLLDKSFGDLTSDLTTNFQNYSAEAFTSLLIVQAAETLGVDGFKGQVFTTTGSTIGGQLTNNIADAIVNNKALTEAQLLMGFEKFKLLSSVGSALGSLLASKVENNLVKIESVSEGLASTVAGIYGGIEGALAASTSVASGLATSAVGSVVGSSLAKAIGALIFPGIGAFLGTLAGQTIGSKIFDLLDKAVGGFFSDVFAKSVYHYQYVDFDATTNSFIRGKDASKNSTSQIRTGTYSIVDAYLESLNEIIKTIGGRVDEATYRNAKDNVLFAYVGKKAAWDGRDEWRVVFGGGSNYINSGADVPRIVRIGLEHQLSKLVLTGGDPLMLKAFEAWQLELPEFKERSGDSLASLMAKLQLAKDMRRYAENKVLYNAVMKSNPESALAFSWTMTSMEWEAVNAKVSANLNGGSQRSGVKVVAGVKEGTQRVSLSWVPVATGSTQQIEQWRFASKQWETIGTVTGSASSFETNQLTPGLKRFRVKTLEGQSNSVSDFSEVTVPLLAPQGVSAQVKPGTQRVTLAWPVVTGAQTILVQQFRWATNVWDTISTLSGSATGFTTITVTPGEKQFRIISTLGSTSAASHIVNISVPILGPRSVSAQLKPETQQVNLSWSAAIGAESISVQQFRWETSIWETIGNVSGSATGFTTIPLTSGTKRFRIVLHAGSVKSEVNANDIVILGATTVSLKPDQVADTIRIDWQPVDGAAGYRVLLVTGNGTHKLLRALGREATTFTTGKMPVGNHRILVQTYLGSRTMNSAEAETTILATPVAQSQLLSPTTIQISWQPTAGATSIEIYQFRWATGAYEKIGTALPTETSFTTTVVTSGAKQFVLRAIAGTTFVESPPTSVVTVLQPKGVTVTPIQGSRSVDVSWAADGGDKIESYVIYLKNVGTNGYSLLGKVAGTITNFRTDALPTGVQQILVQAMIGDKSANSDEVPTTILATPVAQSQLLSPTTIQISWQPVAAATSMEIYQFRWAARAYERIGTVSGSTTSFTTTVSTSGEKTFLVKALSDSTFVESAPTFVVTVLEPKGVTVTPIQGSRSVDVAWAIDGGDKIESYKIWLKNVGTDGYSLLGSVAGSATTFRTDTLPTGIQKILVQATIGSKWANSAEVATALLATPVAQSQLLSPTTIQISWQPVAAATSMEIYQFRWAAGAYERIGIVSGSITSFTTSVSTSGEKKFLVKAIAGNAFADSVPTSVVTVIASTVSASATSSRQVALNWSADPGVQGWRVWQWKFNENRWALLTTADVNTTSFLTSAVTPGAKRFKIEAFYNDKIASTTVDLNVL